MGNTVYQRRLPRGREGRVESEEAHDAVDVDEQQGHVRWHWLKIP